jgi:hypothetical protein
MPPVCARSCAAVIVVIGLVVLSRPPLTYSNKASVSREVDTEGKRTSPALTTTPDPTYRRSL